jgi:predicted CXXCH cytochrome family protein
MMVSRVRALELSLFAVLLGLSLIALRRLGLSSRRALFCLGALSSALGLALAVTARRGADAAAAAPIHVAASSGFASSDACRSCHPTQYQSWHDSFHRSMTELPTAATVRAPWGGVLSWRGRDYTLFRRDDQFWVKLPEQPALQPGAERDPRAAPALGLEQRILMTTGSHHYQAYWLRGERGNELRQLPFVYHFESERFIPRHEAFLQPDEDPEYVARWNANCIQCHSVAGQPGHDLASDRFESRAVELGIACEACHGPAARHVERMRDPWVRQRQHDSREPDPAIVNPARLDALRASEVCGQCHAYFLPRQPDRWWESGFTKSYRPGEALEPSRRLLHYEPGSTLNDPELSASLDSLFYSDGTARVGGREYNGLSRSACFSAGHGARQLACTSCHQMHGGTRDDQLDAEAGSDGACTSCHGGLGERHTHHAADSNGSRCVNCHMPRTSYALFKSIRSHRITRPLVDRDPGAPLNACNACHQDRSLSWTSSVLEAWSTNGVADEVDAPPELDASWSAIALAALRGDAAARVIAAAELGAREAREVSGAGWQAQLLVEALDDPYAAVRFVARRSLRSWPGFEGFEFDFIAPRPERLARQSEARQRAVAGARAWPGQRPPPLPLDDRGVIPADVIADLTRARDDRPIRIAE